MATLRAISNYKGGYFPYHLYITDDDGPIYITQWLIGYTYHNSNIGANKDSIAVCCDGNYVRSQPSQNTLKKLKQVLDDLDSNWFKKNGWVDFAKYLNVKTKKRHAYNFGKTVYTLHWHNEVAKTGTACCGNKLMAYVKEYRDKAGKVNWFSEEESIDCTKFKEIIKKQEGTINSFKAQISSLEKEIHNLKIKNQDLKAKHQDELKDLRTAHLREKERLKEEYKQDLARAKRKLLEQTVEKNIAELDDAGKVFSLLLSQLFNNLFGFKSESGD
jgi:hypothetical protein